jgi:hypothetical protein
MKTDDLTQVKYIGASRMKSLNNLGITTIKQLYETPLDKLAQIETIGGYYAKLIKDAVNESYGKKPEKTAPDTVSGGEKKGIEVKQDLKKQIRVLKRSLKRASEDLKSSGKKKYHELYIDFKKRAKTLMKRLDGLDQTDKTLSKKDSKNIVKKAYALNAMLKDLGKKPKRQKCKKISRKLQSFSKILKKTSS